MKKYITFSEIANPIQGILMTLDNKYQKEILAPDGEKLSLICVIPIKNISEILISNGFLLENKNIGKYIYIFSYYIDKEYFLDSITYNGTKEEYQSIKSGYTKIIIEDEDYIDINSENLYEISLNNNSVEASWFGGEPELLQHENNCCLDNYLFLAQINGLDLPNKLDDIFYLSDAIGYVYLKKDLTEGLFFVQNT